ncbi:MAG: trypsin-like peptidase domain-containing protein [Rhodospirillales bacterium]|nr:trypsin-like peptidase domain-containing protein [Rhodospirillales bacterium]
MTDDSPPGDAPPTRPPGEAGRGAPPRRWSRHIPFTPVWLASVGVLLLASAALTTFLLTRQPETIERLIPAPPTSSPSVSPEDLSRTAVLRKQNEALEAQLRQLQETIAAPQCPPGTAIDARAGGVGSADPQASGMAPANNGPDATTADQSKTAALLLPPAGLPPAGLPPAGPKVNGPLAPALPNAELSHALDLATAMVLTPTSTATGFFITDTLLLSNRHAVETAKDGQLLIASSSLGRARIGTVLATSPAGEPGAADFALVRLAGGKAPGVLPLATQFSKLMRVVAAGYPFFSIETDAGFRRLAAGDARAAPDLNVTTGTIQAVQRTPQGLTAIVHEAAILKGNSGGPLIDACGRVIGINTFIAVDKEQSARNNFALATADIVQFLQSANVRIAVDSRACAG